jgi:hypothetical protein
LGSIAGNSFSEAVGARRLLFNNLRKQTVRNATGFPHKQTPAGLLAFLQLSQIPCFRDDSDFRRTHGGGPSIALC